MIDIQPPVDYASPRYGTPGWGVFLCIAPRPFQKSYSWNTIIRPHMTHIWQTEMLAPICFTGDTVYFRPSSETIVRLGFVRGGVWQNPGFNTIWRYRLYLIFCFIQHRWHTHPSLFMHRFFPPHTENKTPFDFHWKPKTYNLPLPTQTDHLQPRNQRGEWARGPRGAAETRWVSLGSFGCSRHCRCWCCCWRRCCFSFTT